MLICCEVENIDGRREWVDELGGGGVGKQCGSFRAYSRVVSVSACICVCVSPLCVGE